MGENYQKVFANLGEGDYNDPRLTERTLGDLVDPSRSGSVMGTVNIASRVVGSDVEEWSLVRIMGLAEGVIQDSRKQAQG